MTRLVTSTVVRGSRRGESHGSVYLIDLDKRSVKQILDWNTPNIDWRGRGTDRGLRGIAFDNDRVYVAASNELLAFTPEFKLLGSWRNPLLMHCQQIAIWERTLYVASAGFDSILGFDLDKQKFHWVMHVQSSDYQFKYSIFDPLSDDGPLPLNKLHLNNLHCNTHGMYISGLRTGGMLHFNGNDINMAVTLPSGSHNAQPFRDGVLFNDSEANVLRYTGRGEGAEDRAMPVPDTDTGRLQHVDAVTDGYVRPGFARGLCVLSDRVVAGGSSPATVTLYDLADNETLGSVRMSADVRSSIHGLEKWPYD